MPRGRFSRVRECAYVWKLSRELKMHIRHARKAPAVSLAMSLPAEGALAERRRFLQILFGASLAAASLSIAGCATTKTGDESPRTYRRGAGNRGGDAAGSHR